jgi:hypothetical protein
MNPVRAIDRLACILAGLAVAFAAAPAALATPRPRPPGWNKHPPLPAHAHALVTLGLPGWQITLIAAGAAVAAALPSSTRRPS